MLLTFTGQVRIAEEGIYVRHFEKGGEYEVSEKLGERILELFPSLATRVKKEAPKLETKETGNGKLVIKSGKTKNVDDEEE